MAIATEQDWGSARATIVERWRVDARFARASSRPVPRVFGERRYTAAVDGMEVKNGYGAERSHRGRTRRIPRRFASVNCHPRKKAGR